MRRLPGLQRAVPSVPLDELCTSLGSRLSDVHIHPDMLRRVVVGPMGSACRVRIRASAVSSRRRSSTPSGPVDDHVGELDAARSPRRSPSRPAAPGMPRRAQVARPPRTPRRRRGRRRRRRSRRRRSSSTRPRRRPRPCPCPVRGPRSRAGRARPRGRGAGQLGQHRQQPVEGRARVASRRVCTATARPFSSTQASVGAGLRSSRGSSRDEARPAPAAASARPRGGRWRSSARCRTGRSTNSSRPASPIASADLVQPAEGQRLAGRTAGDHRDRADLAGQLDQHARRRRGGCAPPPGPRRSGRGCRRSRGRPRRRSRGRAPARRTPARRTRRWNSMGPPLQPDGRRRVSCVVGGEDHREPVEPHRAIGRLDPVRCRGPARAACRPP